jgi:predicted nucleic acid-binding protein
VTFFDTNVIVYANDPRYPAKQRVALDVIRRHLSTGEAVVSTQVFAEYASIAVTKLRHEPETVLHELAMLEAMDVVQVTPRLVRRGLELKQLYGINFWDGCILAAAEQARCGVILSEDLNPGQSYAGVRVENPFA